MRFCTRNHSLKQPFFISTLTANKQGSLFMYKALEGTGNGSFHFVISWFASNPEFKHKLLRFQYDQMRKFMTKDNSATHVENAAYND